MTRRKDRVLNTRIPEDLDREIREQAERLDMSVSQFVRDVLQRTVNLVGNLSGNVEQLVHNIVDDVGEFRSVGLPERTAQTAVAKEIGRSVLGWQEIKANRAARCPVTGLALQIGDAALLGIRANGRPSVMVAPSALDELLARNERVWLPITIQNPVACANSGRTMEPGESAWFSPADTPPQFICDEEHERLVGSRQEEK